MKKIIIVPAYNEEENIGRVLAATEECCPDFDILVINDGSTDRTSEIARKFGSVRVIDLPVNLGIGGAVQTGFIYSKEKGYEVAVQIDGDGQHKPGEVRKVLSPLLDGKADVVIGSRFIKRGSYKSLSFRKVGIKMFELTNRLLLGERITDSTSGFRAYNKKSIELLSRDYPDDYPEPEAIYFLKKNGMTIIEVPVEMDTRQGGKSSISLVRSVYYMVKVFLAIFVLILRKHD
ncbi:MAG: glycosyltransferase family 2 protein [Clostridiales bacterium]|nr:glycosyltransferase family 2 protein [Clostridiales bacterium]